MKRLCRRLSVSVAVLVWLGALVYLLVLSRRRLPELGTGGGGPGGPGGEAANSQVKYHRESVWRVCVSEGKTMWGRP
ncbi:Sec-independent protein translocase protein TatA, partial [Dissostichus eleginoides]